jgi:hypothetical protein
MEWEITEITIDVWKNKLSWANSYSLFILFYGKMDRRRSTINRIILKRIRINSTSCIFNNWFFIRFLLSSLLCWGFCGKIRLCQSRILIIIRRPKRNIRNDANRAYKVKFKSGANVSEDSCRATHLGDNRNNWSGERTISN